MRRGLSAQVLFVAIICALAVGPGRGVFFKEAFAAPAGVTSLGELVYHPDDYLGEPVTIKGSVPKGRFDLDAGSTWYDLWDDTGQKMAVKLSGTIPYPELSSVTVTGIFRELPREPGTAQAYYVDNYEWKGGSSCTTV